MILVLILFRPNGVTFEVPPHDVLIPTPAIGTVVTFCYESYARRDVPLNPIITRVRSDIVWNDMICGSVHERSAVTSKFLSLSSPLLPPPAYRVYTNYFTFSSAIWLLDHDEHATVLRELCQKQKLGAFGR